MKKVTISLVALALCIVTMAQPTESKDRYTPELLWKLGRVSEPVVSPDLKTVLFGISWYNLEANKGNRDLYTIPTAGGQVQKVTSFKGNEANGVFLPGGKKIAFLSTESGSSQIWEVNIDGTSPIQLTHIAGDISGFAFSPKMDQLLYTQRVKLDKSVNDVYPDLPKANAYVEDDLMYRHWDSWSDYSYSHIFVAPVTSKGIGEGKDIMKDERYDAPMLPWGGMEQICCSPDGKQLVYVCKKLSGLEYTLSTNSEIYQYDIASGQTINISKGLAGYDQDPVYSPDGKKIVWRSMARAGFESDKDRIMIYDVASKTYEDYSKDFDQSSMNFVWSPDSQKLFFISGYHGIEQVYKLDLGTRKIAQVSHGQHDYVSITSAGNNLIGLRQSMVEPSELFTLTPDGTQNRLTYVNDEILKGVKSAKVEERWVTTTDNKKMLVWVVYPPDFDPNKKYPTLLYCEGGPQSMVSQFFSYRWNFEIMTANNYIVVAPNRRGLPGFGQEWNDQISGDYGGQNMKDYFSAIDDVAKEPYVNKDKLGAVGASYGGFSVLWMAGHHEKRFKAFIAHCGIFNFEQMYVTTDELWFANWELGGPYWDRNNPKVQRSYSNSPHLFVDKWDTPIMIIEGEHDFRIPYTQGMAAFDAAKLRGIPARYVDFPEESHWVLRPQNSVLWQREYFRWLDQWLK